MNRRTRPQLKLRETDSEPSVLPTKMGKINHYLSVQKWQLSKVFDEVLGSPRLTSNLEGRLTAKAVLWPVVRNNAH